MDDKIKVTAHDVAAQRQAMKKPGAAKATVARKIPPERMKAAAAS